jgi:hypothetical protein
MSLFVILGSFLLYSMVTYVYLDSGEQHFSFIHVKGEFTYNQSVALYGGGIVAYGWKL